jgi:biopolymer transport protein ExbD
MKIRAQGPTFVDLDYTPMIDMSFQLIAFFMILLNFSGADQDERVMLPTSVLAKPPALPLVEPITIQVAGDGSILMGGPPLANAAAIEPLLLSERYVLERQKQKAADATIVIRAHKDVQTGLVQDVIKVCQKAGFETFALRAKTDDDY